MKLEENCRKSMRNCTRRINIRYFFVIDRLTAGDIYIKYYPTEKMVVDFYTKPFYGKLFRMFRNLILNCVDTQSDFFTSTLKMTRVKVLISLSRLVFHRRSVLGHLCFDIN